MDDRQLSPLEELARRIEVLYLPTYEPTAANYLTAVDRADVYADLVLIVTAIRRTEHRLAAELEHLRQSEAARKERA